MKITNDNNALLFQDWNDLFENPRLHEYIYRNN